MLHRVIVNLLIGNQMLYTLTTKWKYTLRVDLQAYDGVRVYSEYTTFIVNSPGTMYKLTVAGYSGNASVDEGSLIILFKYCILFHYQITIFGI